MCGIFGVVSRPDSSISSKKVYSIFERLFLMSESRGKESSGVVFLSDNQASVLKSPSPASDFVESLEYRQLKNRFLSSDSAVGLVGHSRLVTNGICALNLNNQPVCDEDRLMIHNGIVVNDEELLKEMGARRESVLDTEALFLKIDSLLDSGSPMAEAMTESFQSIEGTASVCFFDAPSQLMCLATNNGSIYFWFDSNSEMLIFASESYILKCILEEFDYDSDSGVEHLAADSALLLNVHEMRDVRFELTKQDKATAPTELISVESGASFSVIDHSARDYPDFDNTKRCTKCILPESFPGITFDDEGVCSKCRTHEQPRLEDVSVLLNAVEKYRRPSGQADCLVGLSGGRDSCYGLHVIKEELGLNPIAYTYDWGLVTDLARRNISRMCSKLGVEHILVSADIAKKRGNVRKNMHAWLKKPDISMIPLFMAGDKQFYYYAHQLRKQTGVDLFMFAAGNAYERTDFKIAFSGLKGNSGQGILTDIGYFDKLKLAMSYGTKFLGNPRYLNSSLADTLHAFYSSYLLKDDYFYLYYYHKWNEDTVNDTLLNVYDWEGSPDTSTTWRVGDGTAAFYNYVYYVVCGFTEHDTFRSNQVRDGALTRDEALKKAKEDNKPRWDSLEWYARTIGFNLDEALVQIHKMKKMY